MEILALAKSLNAVLPPDVVVRGASIVPNDFNARYSAKSRQYKYYIRQEPIAIQRNYCWQVFYDLDVELMQRCAKIIQGEHDFSSFCKVDVAAHHNRCIVYSAEWNQNGRSLIFEIKANRFLYGMVRAFVGTMVNVGRGYTKVDDFEKIIEAKDRSVAGPSAPAKGLFLDAINY